MRDTVDERPITAIAGGVGAGGGLGVTRLAGFEGVLGVAAAAVTGAVVALLAFSALGIAASR